MRDQGTISCALKPMAGWYILIIVVYTDMPLFIKNKTAERLARQVAGETGESLTQAIQKSLEERWERLKRRRKGHILTGQIEDLLRRVDALPNLDTRPEDEILGYGEDGIPR
jgi:antitoxin VapB